MRGRIVISIVLTLALLFVARRISRNRSVEVSLEEQGYTIRHTSLFEHVGPGEPVVSLTVQPDPGVKPLLLVYYPAVEKTEGRKMTTRGGGLWEATLPEMRKGSAVEYAVTIPILSGDAIGVTNGGDYFRVRYKGEYSTVVIVLHVIFMFGSFFFMIYTFLAAMRLAGDERLMPHAVKALRLVLVTTFIGGWPLGFILNYQRFGVVWEGFPFGWDVTDNKTQLLFLFWVVTALLVRGSFLGRGPTGDSIGPRGLSWAIMISFAVSLALFLVPHSL